jgi:hypothetical protein
MNTCFVIKRAYSQTMFSVNHGRTDGTRPSVLIFENKKDAQRMKRLMDDCAGPQKRQKLVIEKFPTPFIIRTCSTSGLDVACVRPDGDVFRFNLGNYAALDDYVFSLENTFKYSNTGSK